MNSSGFGSAPQIDTPLPTLTLKAPEVAVSPIKIEPETPTTIAVPSEPTAELPSPADLIGTYWSPSLQQLTQGGCCVNPFWSADSQSVLFIDRPAPEALAGIWGVDLEGGEPRFVSERVGILSGDQLFRAFPVRGETFVESILDGQWWAIPNEGRAVVFSKDSAQLAWTSGRSATPFDNGQRQIWSSNVDGSNPRGWRTLLGAGISSWFPDGRLLVTGRLEAPESGQALWVLSPPASGEVNSEITELARGERLRGVSLSPSGEWLAYVVAFAADPAQNGLWLLNTHTLDRRKIDQLGAYRWRNMNQLLLVPLEMDKPFNRLLQVNPASGEIVPITDIQSLPYKISNGDWSVSPDGNKVVFVSALDGNIWLLTLENSE